MKAALYEAKRIAADSGTSTGDIVYGFREQRKNAGTTGIVIDLISTQVIRTMDNNDSAVEVFTIEYNIMGPKISVVILVAELLEGNINSYGTDPLFPRALIHTRISGKDLFTDIDGYNYTIQTEWTVRPGADTEIGL